MPTLLVVAMLLLVVPAVQGLPAPLRPSPASTNSPSPCAGDHWVGAWVASPQGSSLGRPDDVPWGDADGMARSFEDQTLRMVVSPRADGSALRVRLGNRFGVAPVTIGAATVGSKAVGAAVVPGTVRALTFGGAPTVVLAAGEEALSDPVFTDVHAFDELVVSFHVVGAGVLDHHQWAQATSYATPVATGDHTADLDGAAFTETLAGWYGAIGLDVLASRTVGAVVTLGDSITDGIGSTPDADRRWPDLLAERLAGAAIPLSVVNAGISGNHVTTSGLTSVTAIGPSATERVATDALGVAGVTDLLVFEGINDIYMSDPATTDVAAQVIAGYRTIIDAAHAAGLRVIGATITPASMDGAKESARLAINEWIRTSGAYDAVVDFDAVVRDPADPSRLRPSWDAHLAHLNDAGYAAMAEAVDLSVFAGADC